MSKSSDRLQRDIYSIGQRINQEGSKFNDFLEENAFATISTAIQPGVRLSQIDLASPGLKGKMLRYSKFVLMFPDGSNPTVIELKVSNLPVGATTINIYADGQNAWEQDIFPDFGYPVGSLIAGLDYEANSILAAAGDGSNTNEVQYNFGGFLASSGLTGQGSGGSNYDFSFNPASGVLNADGGFNSSGLITSKQRQAINCGFYHSTSSIVYLPFGYGGTNDATSSSGYLEFGGYVVPCNGYVDYVVVRGESPGRNTTVGFVKASAGTEVPVLSGAAGLSDTVDMLYDDTAYRFDNFRNQGGQIANTFSAGDVIMFTLDTTNPLYDAIATAVLVFDWNNQL